MTSNYLSGLVVTLNVGETVYLSRRDGRVAVVSVKLEATSPWHGRATVSIGIAGDRSDLEAIGLKADTAVAALSPDKAVEILSGIRIAVGDGKHVVKSHSAPLVIDAPRDVWLIEREEMIDRQYADKIRNLAPRNED